MSPALLVTDLDNTLWDWMTFFTRSFEALVAELAGLVGAPPDALRAEFRAVHQRWGLTELPFATLELPRVQAALAGLDRGAQLARLAPAFAAFEAVRERELRLYPGVAETLAALAAAGVPVVGYTESVAANAHLRLKRLGIRDFFARIYVLDTPLPAHPAPEAGTAASYAAYHVVPFAERKPNPAVLARICGEMGVAVADTVYIGDSLTRDVLLAKKAGARAVWAAYGTKVEDEIHRQLFAVSHWTPEEIAREQELVAQAQGVTPDLVAESFADVLPLLTPS